MSLLFLLYNLLTGDFFGKPEKINRISICKVRQHLSNDSIEDAIELKEFAEYAYSLEFE